MWNCDLIPKGKGKGNFKYCTCFMIVDIVYSEYLFFSDSERMTFSP